MCLPTPANQATGANTGASQDAGAAAASAAQIAAKTAAMASLTMQVSGAASSAVGAYYSAKSTKASLNLQADLADINARMSESAAQSTLLTGQRQEQQSRIATANLKGTQRASMAANGIDLGEGTAAQVLTSTDVLGEVDAATIQANALHAAWGYRAQGVNQTNQAAMSRAAADAVSPNTGAFTSLLGSAGSVAASWYSMSKAGLTQPLPAGGNKAPTNNGIF